MRPFFFILAAAALLTPLHPDFLAADASSSISSEFSKTPEERCSDGVWLVRTGDYDQAAAELIIERSCLDPD